MDPLGQPDQPSRPVNGKGSRRRSTSRFGRTTLLVSAGAALVAVAGVGAVEGDDRVTRKGVEADPAAEDMAQSGPKRILSWNPDGELTELPFDDASLRGPSSWTPEVSGDWVLVGDHSW